MKRQAVIFAAFASLLAYRAAQNGMVCSILYIALSYLLNSDADIPRNINHDGEIQDGILMHRFIPLSKTYSGAPVNITYHVVECGDRAAEPIVFFHGLAESWEVWKYHMKSFCDTNYVVSVDSEGMGQSAWEDVLKDLPEENSRGFMADMIMGLLSTMKIQRFNLVVTDYSFWTTLPLLTAYGDVIIRYGKFQSTVGVEDVDRSEYLSL